MSQKKPVKAPLRQIRPVPQEHRIHADQDRDRTTLAPCPSRRTFLAVAAGATLTALTALGTTPPLSFVRRAQAAERTGGGASADAAAGFLRLSMFVTGQRDLNPETSGRYYVALSRRDPAFPSKIGALLSHIDQAKFTDMDVFLAAVPVETPLRATASGVVSAWYLGIVGEAADAELIAYADALMYRPTRGVLAVPTYGPGPLAWGDKPAQA